MCLHTSPHPVECLNAPMTIAELARAARRSWESLGNVGSVAWGEARTRGFATPAFAGCALLELAGPCYAVVRRTSRTVRGRGFEAAQVCSISLSSYRQPWTPECHGEVLGRQAPRRSGSDQSSGGIVHPHSLQPQRDPRGVRRTELMLLPGDLCRCPHDDGGRLPAAGDFTDWN
jgi:hypothetical protein